MSKKCDYCGESDSKVSKLEYYGEICEPCLAYNLIFNFVKSNSEYLNTDEDVKTGIRSLISFFKELK